MKRLLSVLIVGLCVATSPASGEGTQKEFWRKSSWTTPDGVRLVGLYHRAQRPGALTWVLLHGLGSVKGEWEPFGRKLARQGSGVLIYDARGHNESNRLVTGETITYQSWSGAGPGTPWDAMPADLESTVQWLEKHNGLSEKKIAVGGASLGANVALVYASQHPKVPAVILLSPGLEFAGIQAGAAFEAYRGRPLFIAASPGDLYSYSSVRQLTDRAPARACRRVDGKTGHGVNMLDEEFTKTLLGWMKDLNGNRNRRPS